VGILDAAAWTVLMHPDVRPSDDVADAGIKAASHTLRTLVNRYAAAATAATARRSQGTVAHVRVHSAWTRLCDRRLLTPEAFGTFHREILQRAALMWGWLTVSTCVTSSYTLGP
jgi:hypothetical protein